MLKIRKGDTVTVMMGKDKGKQGVVEKVLTADNMVKVPGVNMFKKHQKRRNKETAGSIIDIVKPLPISKVSFHCPKCKKNSRIAFQSKGKEKYRVCSLCKEIV